MQPNYLLLATKKENKLYAKFLSHLSELSDIRLFFVRYLVNLIVFIEILMLPALLSVDFYTEVEVVRQAFLVAPACVLGANSGLLYRNYSLGHDASSSLLIFSVFSALIAGVVVSFIFTNVWVGLALAVLVAISGIEKILVLENRLIAASTYKSCASVIAIAYAVLLFVFLRDVRSIDFYSQCVFFGGLLWLCYLMFSRALKRNIKSIKLYSTKTHIRNAFCLMKSGLMISVQSYILLAYLILDRQMILKQFPSHAAEYSIAFSLSQMVFIAVNTVGFSAQRKIGVEISSMTVSAYQRSLKMTFTVFGVLFVIALPCVYAFSYLVSGYGSFLLSFVLIVLIYGAYYVYSVFSMVAYYKGFSHIMLISLVLSVVVNYFLTGCFLNQGYVFHIVQSGFVLLFSALCIDYLIRRVLKND